MKKIWITWEKQRRNAGISSGVGAELFELISSKKGFLRYIELSRITIEIINKNKPDVVFAQNPSMVLALLVVLMKNLYRYKVVIDAHNIAIFPHYKRWLPLGKLVRYLQKKAFLTIVTNCYLCKHVERNGGRGFVLPDRIPTLNPNRINLEGNKKIVFICTFSEDEPYFEVINAARHLDNNFIIYFTGNFMGKVDPGLLPYNIKLLGFMPEEQYLDTLNSADVIMDLTTRENCLVCGAYEGLALNKPLILSNTLINREFFNIGCVYVDPNSKSVEEGILQCFASYAKYQKMISSLKKTLEKKWNRNIKNLLNEINVNDFHLK